MAPVEAPIMAPFWGSNNGSRATHPAFHELSGSIFLFRWRNGEFLVCRPAGFYCDATKSPSRPQELTSITCTNQLKSSDMAIKLCLQIMKVACDGPEVWKIGKFINWNIHDGPCSTTDMRSVGWPEPTCVAHFVSFQTRLPRRIRAARRSGRHHR